MGTEAIYCPPCLSKHKDETSKLIFEIGYNAYNEDDAADAIEMLAKFLNDNLASTHRDLLIFRLAEKSQMYSKELGLDEEDKQIENK